MTKGLIYKISNTVNDKIYIGQTIQQLSRRWQKHISDSKKKDTHLYRAIRRRYRLHGNHYIYLDENKNVILS